ncbi:MAG TPA: VOC family protein [Chitinophagaceae bacterium]|nr:VOC family protein [Chitinophagaceae bacterium]
MGIAEIKTSITPWLTVQDSEKAAGFYKSAFAAIETYRLDIPGEPILRLSINGAEFWIGGDSQGTDTGNLGGGTVRMILSVPDPDTVFAKALVAGATEVFPVHEDHGWRIGRITDPFGLHWEIGCPLE